MWQFLDSILEYHTYHNSRVIDRNHLRKEMRHLDKNESIMNTLNNCALLRDSYFKALDIHRQLSDWLKIKSIALGTKSY